MEETTCTSCSGKDLEIKEGSVIDGALVEHRGGTAYLQCQQCGQLLYPPTSTSEAVAV